MFRPGPWSGGLVKRYSTITRIEMPRYFGADIFTSSFPSKRGARSLNL